MKRFFFQLFLLLSSTIYGQNITFVYELKYKTNLNRNDLITEEYYLDVLGKQSIFRSEKERRSDSLVEKTGYGLGRSSILGNQIYIQKNLISKDITKIITTLFNDNYSIKINDKLDWIILSDKMKIGDYDCQKAKVNYGGRSWIAWFTQSIPLQDGPYVFNGLPGFIIRISDNQSHYDFSLVKTNNSNKNNMFALRKGKVITWEVFKKMQTDYYSDPYAEIKARNIKFQVGDSNGNKIPMDMKTLTKNLQNQIKENNNSIELNYKVDYKVDYK